MNYGGERKSNIITSDSIVDMKVQNVWKIPISNTKWAYAQEVREKERIGENYFASSKNLLVLRRTIGKKAATEEGKKKITFL